MYVHVFSLSLISDPHLHPAIPKNPEYKRGMHYKVSTGRAMRLLGLGQGAGAPWGASSSNQRGSRDLILWIWILFSLEPAFIARFLLCSSPRATMEKPSPPPAPPQRSRPGRQRAARYAPYRRLRERAARLTYAERATHAQISSLVQAGDDPPRLLRSSSSNGGG